MDRIYKTKINVEAYEEAYVKHAARHTPTAYSEDDINYIKDFKESWESTVKDGYIEIDNIDRLICDRLTIEEFKHIRKLLSKEAIIEQIPRNKRIPKYKKPYQKTKYVDYTFEDMGMKDPRDLGKS